MGPSATSNPEAPKVISKATGLSRQTVYRIKDDRAGSEVILREWGM